MKNIRHGKRLGLAVAVIGLGVALISLVTMTGEDAVNRIWRANRPILRVGVTGVLTKLNTKAGDKYYLDMDNYWWNEPTGGAVFQIEVVPVADNWEKVRTLVGDRVKIIGRKDREAANKMTIETIEEMAPDESVEGQRKISGGEWSRVTENGLGIEMRYPAILKKKMGIFNQKTTWVWEGVSVTKGDVWGMTIGSERPWATQDNLCEGENWGCREIGTMKILIAGKEYLSPIWVTKSGGRIFQFTLEAAVGQPTVTGYYAIKSQGQLLADVLSHIR